MTMPHFAKIVKEKIANIGWELLPHPPYLPDLAPFDSHLFCSLSNDLRGKIFEKEENLKTKLAKIFDSRNLCQRHSRSTKTVGRGNENVWGIHTLKMIFSI